MLSKERKKRRKRIEDIQVIGSLIMASKPSQFKGTVSLITIYYDRFLELKFNRLSCLLKYSCVPCYNRTILVKYKYFIHVWQSYINFNIYIHRILYIYYNIKHIKINTHITMFDILCIITNYIIITLSDNNNTRYIIYIIYIIYLH